ncbi:MAG: hypothetical protein HQ521_09400 [Bacteroidetes bacterium]|nr:hypothetical protein [Bacteroidota bacterium]
MKRLSVFLIASLAVVMIMSSCKKDEDTFGPPTINFVGGSDYVDSDATIAENTFFKVGIAAIANTESNEKLASLSLTRTMFGIVYTDTTLSINETTYAIDFEFNSQAAGVVETIVFTVTDKAGKSAEKSLVITYEASAVSVSKNIGVTMGSYNDDNGSFYSTVTNQVYNKADATDNQSKIDFLFYLGAQNASTIASPADIQAKAVFEIANWTIHNETLFAETTITDTEFDAIGDSYLFPEFTGTLTDVNHLESGDVIMFKTVDNRLGLIKVSSINGRGDYISLDIIVSG